MKSLTVTLIAPLISISLFATSPQDVVQRDSFDEAYLVQLVHQKVNEFRTRKKRRILKPDESLTKAAACQANYMLAKNRCTHRQLNQRYSTPWRRAEAFGFQAGTVGENALQSWVDFPGDGRPPHTYDSLATHLANMWKQSSAHYKNILDKSYYNAGIAVAIDYSNGKIFAAQVFGGKTLDN